MSLESRVGNREGAWRRLERWLAGLGSDPLPAVVLGGGPNGLSFARSLGRHRVPVVLFDGVGGIARHSRYAHAVSLGGPLQFGDDWIDALERLTRSLPGGAALFATNDTLISLIARHEEQLARSYRFVGPPRSLVELIVNKRTQYLFAEEHGIPIPHTRFPSSRRDVEDLCATMPFPCILKPYESAPGRAVLGKKAIKAEDADGLLAAFDQFGAGPTQLMVQELIPGDDSQLFGYFGFWARDGVEHSWLTKRKLRQYPIGLGDGSLQCTVDAPEVRDLARTLLGAMRYRGFVSAEFKRDPRNGELRFIEANPRTASGNQMGAAAGVDFPWLGYRSLTLGDGEAEDAPEFRRGVQYVDEILDLRAFLALRAEGKLSTAAWLRSHAATRACAVWSPTDPVPFVAQAWQLLDHRRTRR
jgi:predicted ATP-grasp superfamily ATP-dependent carboligase